MFGFLDFEYMKSLAQFQCYMALSEFMRVMAPSYKISPMEWPGSNQLGVFPSHIHIIFTDSSDAESLS